jgi:hypothetical protein
MINYPYVAFCLWMLNQEINNFVNNYLDIITNMSYLHYVIYI